MQCTPYSVSNIPSLWRVSWCRRVIHPPSSTTTISTLFITDQFVTNFYYTCGQCPYIHVAHLTQQINASLSFSQSLYSAIFAQLKNQCKKIVPWHIAFIFCLLPNFPHALYCFLYRTFSNSSIYIISTCNFVTFQFIINIFTSYIDTSESIISFFSHRQIQLCSYWLLFHSLHPLDIHNILSATLNLLWTISHSLMFIINIHSQLPSFPSLPLISFS